MVKNESIAEDLAQEAFIKVNSNLDRLSAIRNIKAWLFKIAYHLCLDHFRSVKNNNERKNRIRKKQSDINVTSIQENLEQHQMSSCVQDKMTMLPASLKSVLHLYDILEFSHNEIAQTLGITPNTSKVRLHRARKKLKDILKKECKFENDSRNVLVCIPALKRSNEN